MESKVTISRRSNQKGSGTVAITITDCLSGMSVAEVEMSLLEFAECVTGMGNCAAKMTLAPNEFLVQNIGKKKETKTVNLPWKKRFDSNTAELDALIEPFLDNGWMLWSDGLNTQQNQKGHDVILYRFVAIEPSI